MTVQRSFWIAAMTALLLLTFSPAQAAKQDTVHAIIPWDGEGQVFQIDTKTAVFLGSFQGIMYIESSKGDMNEAFVMCPVMQEVALESGASEAHGHCEISVSGEDVVFAEFSCKGEIGGCNGTFTLTDGEGQFAGISGEGELQVRSPIHSLVADMAAGAVVRVATGLATIKNLKYRIP